MSAPVNYNPQPNVYITNENFFSRNGQKILLTILVILAVMVISLLYMWWKNSYINIKTTILSQPTYNPTSQPSPDLKKLLQEHRIIPAPNEATRTGVQIPIVLNISKNLPTK